MIAEGRVGEHKVAGGVTEDARLGSYAELIANDVGFGRYFEAVRNGRLYHLASAGVTVATAGAVTNPVLALLMPASGTKAAVVIEAIWTPKTVGTFAAYTAALYGAAGLNGTAVSNVTPVNALLGGGASSGKGFAAVASTFTSAPPLLRPLAFSLLVTPAGQNIGWREEVAGSIIVPQGAGVAISPSASQTAGTADAALV